MSDGNHDGGWAAVLIPSLVAALIGGLAGWYAGGGTDSPGERAAARIVVMNTAAWVEQAAQQDVARDEVQTRFAEIERTATELRTQGYIVLYPEAVMEAPSARLIGPEQAAEILQ